MSSECTGKEMGMRFLSTIIGPFLTPAKCVYLGRCYRQLTRMADQSNMSIAGGDRLAQLRTVRKELLTEIGFAALEIIPVLGSIIRQTHDLSRKRRAGDERRAVDILWGYRAKNATKMAKQFMDEARRIETLTTMPESGPGGDGGGVRIPTPAEEEVDFQEGEIQEDGDVEPGGDGEPRAHQASPLLLSSVASTPDLLDQDPNFGSTDSLDSTGDRFSATMGGLDDSSIHRLFYSGQHHPTGYYNTQSCPDLSAIGS